MSEQRIPGRPGDSYPSPPRDSRGPVRPLTSAVAAALAVLVPASLLLFSGDYRPGQLADAAGRIATSQASPTGGTSTPGALVGGSGTPGAGSTLDPSPTAKPSSTPQPTRPPASQAPRTGSGTSGSATNLAASPSTVYMHYYLWWTPLHWHDKLGGSYPYGAAPAPAPGSMDATGCNPTVKYPSATIIDVPSEGLYDQGQGATFDRHIAAAAGAGITGFLVNWQGTGQASQAPASSGYNARLDLLVSRVNAYNATHAAHFRLGLALDAFGNYGRSAAAIINDLNYFRARYATNAAFANRYSSQPIVMLMASRRFALSTISAVSAAERSHVLLLGDETYTSWARDASLLDGTGYYWSSQDPWLNPQSGSQIASLASKVHAAGKAWFAPFNGGFNTQLIGGSTCVPRKGVRTLDAVWSLNVKSAPQGWFGISWNEFVENTYLEPSRLYGSTYLNEIARLIHG